MLTGSPNVNAVLKENNSAPASEVDEEESQSKPSKRRKVIADEELVKTRKSTYKPKTSSKGTKGKRIPKSSVSSSAMSSHRLLPTHTNLPLGCGI